MATIRKETIIRACPALVWAALRDVGALHTRLAPGFVTGTVLENDDRIVTFGNGMAVRERIVSVEDDSRRVAWSATGGMLTHHNASAQCLAEGADCTRFVWIADLLPHEAAPAIAGMIDAGLDAIRAHLEREQEAARR